MTVRSRNFVLAAGAAAALGITPLAAQSREARASTIVNCLRQAEGARAAAPCLRIVPVDDQDAVLALVLEAIRRDPDAAAYEALIEAATLAPVVGVKLLSTALARDLAKRREQGVGAGDDEVRWFAFLQAVMPVTTATAAAEVGAHLSRRHRNDAAENPATRSGLEVTASYAMQRIRAGGSAETEQVDALVRECHQKGTAIFVARAVAREPRWLAVAERLQAEFEQRAQDGTMGEIAAAVAGHLDRLDVEHRAERSLWPSDPAVAQAWLIAEAFPFAPVARWGHALCLAGDDPARRAWAAQCLFQTPPAADEWLLVHRVALQLAASPVATQRAFLGWLRGFPDPERVRWLLGAAVRTWPEDLRRDCAALLGRWRSPSLEVVQTLRDDARARLAIGPDLAIEQIANRVMDCLTSLRSTPAVAREESEQRKLIERIWGRWPDAPPEGVGDDELRVRVQQQLRDLPERPDGAVPRLCRLLLDLDHGDPARPQAVLLALLLRSTNRVEHAAPPMSWSPLGDSAQQRVMVTGDPATWQTLANLLRELPAIPAGGKDAAAPEALLPRWSAAARYAARRGVRWLSRADSEDLMSLWSPPCEFTRTVDSRQRPLFAPVDAVTVEVDGETVTEFRLRSAR